MKKQCILNWSSGKDSAITLNRALENPDLEIKYLVTTLNKVQDRISMHGVRRSLLLKQAESIGIPLKIIELPAEPSMEEYNSIMKEELLKLKEEGIEYSVFGDIFLEDLRKFREEKLSEIGMKGLFPLWKNDTGKLIEEFVKLGFKARIICVNDKYFDKSMCGAELDSGFIKNVPLDVDVCGENGEYHSFVYDGPIFSSPINYTIGDIVYREYNPCNKDRQRCDKNCEKGKEAIGFWYADLIG